MTTRRISLGLGVLKFVRALLTIYSVILSAKYFGASLARDTWIIAGSAVTVLAQILFGPLNEVFRARFIHVRGEAGEDVALEAVSSLFCTIVALSLLVILLVEIAPGYVGTVFAPSFDVDQQRLLAVMMRWMIPTLLFNEITLILIAILNAYQSYFIPDIHSMISVIINVVCIMILAPLIGIYSLILSNYICTAILAYVLIAAVLKTKKKIFRPSLPQWSLLKPFVVASSPFYLAFLVGNTQTTVERVLCTSLGVGNVSVLDYARKFIDMPISVIVGVISTTFGPTLADLFVSGKNAEFHRESVKFLRMLLLGLIPLVAIFLVCANEFVELLLVRGSFDKAFTGVTAQTLALFYLGVIGYVLYSVGGQSLISQNKSARYALVAALATSISIVLNVMFIDRVGLTIFPLTWGITMLSAGVYLLLQQDFNRREMVIEIGKMCAMLVVVLAVTYGVRTLSFSLISSWVTATKWQRFLVLLATGVVSNLLYVVMMFVLDIEEIQGVKRWFTGLWKSPAR